MNCKSYRGLVVIFFLAVSVSACSQADDLAKVKQELVSGKTVAAVLSDPLFDSLHTQLEFRELIRQYAKQHTVTLVTETEPGIRIIARGSIYDAQHQPLTNALIYVYQTDARGWYGSDRVHFQMNEGDRRRARLFGYLKTNTEGQFEITTIRPNGYPQSELPAHIHFEIFDERGRALKITELLFDDDERLQGEIRARSEREGFYISAPVSEKSKKIYSYTISISR
jgi:hypothetical protein